LDHTIRPDAILDLLSSLVDRSLVVADAEESPCRYRTLETIRAFAAERFAASGESARVRERHLEHFMHVVSGEARERSAPWDSVWLARLDPDYANLRAAFEWALAQPRRTTPALLLATGLHWYWWRRSQFVEGRGWLTRAIAAAPRAPKPARAKALTALAHMEYYLGRWKDARDHLARALAMTGKADAVPRTFALCVLAAMEPARKRADATIREASALAGRTSSEWLNAFVAVTAGLIASARHEHRRAVALYERGRRHLDECGDRWLFTFAGANQALQCHLLGEQARAARLAAAAFRESVERGDRRAAAAAIELLAHTAVAGGAAELGARLCGAAEALREMTGVPLAPHWRDAHERTLQAIERQLGAAAADVQRSGRTLPLAALVEEARAQLEGH
jgi:non-specific serine/threonine protein kinase